MQEKIHLDVMLKNTLFDPNYKIVQSVVTVQEVHYREMYRGQRRNKDGEEKGDREQSV